MHKSIKIKLLIYIVPIILFILTVGCTFGILNSRKILQQEMYQNLLTKQDSRFNDIENKISKIKSTIDTFSSNVSNTYYNLGIDTYNIILAETLQNNPNIHNVGVWFEPYTIEPNQEYASTFIENSNDTISYNEYYNSKEFDYLNNELYTRSKETKESFFTPVNYDKLTDSYIITYVTPIKNSNGDFIGCVSTTFNINELKVYISSFAYDLINFYIINSSGVYIANEDIELVTSHTNILDINDSFKKNAQTILDTQTGVFTYTKNGERYYVYYNTLPKFNWKFVYEIPLSLINEPLMDIVLVNVLIFVTTLLAIVAIIFFFSNKFVHAPFQLLLTEFKNISSNNFDSTITQQLVDLDTEFSEVGKALIEMKQCLTDYKNTLENKNQLLVENEKNLSETVNYVNNVINTLPIMMFVFNRDGYCIECHGTDTFNNRQPSFYVGKHCNDVLGDANKNNQDLIDFLNIIKTIDYKDGIIRKHLPLLLHGHQEFFEHSLTLSRENEIISLCRRTTDTVNYLESMKYLSNYDKLTGVFNGRHFNDILEHYISPEKLPISVVIMDVNGFKAINDENEHCQGDKLLIELTNTLNNISVPNKIVARIAGDEFAIVLPNTTKEDAENIFEEINSDCLSKKVFKIPFSISFGIDIALTETDSLSNISKSAEELLYKQKIYTSSGKKDNTIELINSTLLAKNKREQLHSNRVSELCAEMAKALGWSKLDQNKIKTAGLLHDIGKIGISDALLNKPGKLTEEEYKELCTHPEIGYRILQSSTNMKELSEYAYSHHEKWDGTGYPRQLKGTEIVIEARIIAIVDTYDAMTSARSYRDGLPKEVAIAELIRCKNTQFDPELVDIFIEKVLQEKLEDYLV